MSADVAEVELQEVQGEPVPPSPKALVAVAADLERLSDTAPETELDTLLARLPDPDAKPEPKPEPLPELTPDAFAELAPAVSRIWSAVHGEDAATRLEDAGRALGVLAREPAVLEFVDGLADRGGVRLEMAVWDALAAAGKRLYWNGGGPIAKSSIEAFEAADTKTMLLEAAADGVMPKDVLALWANRKLGNAISTIRNARRGVAHLALVAPELVQAGVDAGLARDPDVWRRLAALGQGLPRKDTTKMTTQTKPAGTPTEQEVRHQLEAAMKDRRYWHPDDRDPGYVRKIQEGFAKLYPGTHEGEQK